MIIKKTITTIFLENDLPLHGPEKTLQQPIKTHAAICDYNKKTNQKKTFQQPIKTQAVMCDDNKKRTREKHFSSQLKHMQ